MQFSGADGEKYTVVQETPLGTGGFATVHLAAQDSTGDAVAIKQFVSRENPEMKNGRDVDEEKCNNERIVLERLGVHDNVVQLTAVVDDPDGVPALVLEFMGGGDLINFIKGRPAEATGARSS